MVSREIGHGPARIEELATGNEIAVEPIAMLTGFRPRPQRI